jgi:hypothetical protein
MAHELLTGEPCSVPGWKLVPKRAMRKWVDEEAALKKCKNMRRIKENEYCDINMKSPTQMEKAFKEKNIPYKEIEVFIASVSSGTTLVTDSAPRATITREIPANFIQAIEESK